jgi:hypothetical protein
MSTSLSSFFKPCLYQHTRLRSAGGAEKEWSSKACASSWRINSVEPPSTKAWLIYHALVDGGSTEFILHELAQAFDDHSFSAPPALFSDYINFIHAVNGTGTERICLGLPSAGYKGTMVGCTPSRYFVQYYSATISILFMRRRLPANHSNTGQNIWTVCSRPCPWFSENRDSAEASVNGTGTERICLGLPSAGYKGTNVLQTAWALVLHTYTGAEDVCFGYIAAGRDVPVVGTHSASKQQCRGQCLAELAVRDTPAC